MRYFHFTNWEPVNIEKVMATQWPAAMKEYDNGNKRPLLELFHKSNDYVTLRNGYFRIGGWQFDITDYCRTYWVSTRYYGIIQLYAPDKTTIRGTLGNREVRKIVEV